MLMEKPESVDESGWRSAKARFQIGDQVQGTVSKIVPFGIIVEMPGSLVPGVVIAIGFKNHAAFCQRAHTYPVGSRVNLTVVGASVQRLQIDLRLNL